MLERDIYPGLIRLHILYHACKEDVYGLGMMAELARHGYELSAGTLYPMLHRMQEQGYLTSKRVHVDGKVRRVYRATRLGRKMLRQAKVKVQVLFGELIEGK